MTHHQLLLKRKLSLHLKLEEEGITPPWIKLSDFDFDASKFRTAYDVGGRLVCMIAMSYTNYDPRNCPGVLEWLTREGLLQYLLHDETRFLKGLVGHEVIPYYTFSIDVHRDLAWALNDLKDVSDDELDEQLVPIVSEELKRSLEAEGIDFEKLHKAFGDPRQISFRKSVHMMIEFGTSVQDKLRQLSLRDSEEIFQRFMVCRIKAGEVKNGKDLERNQLEELLNSLVLFGWMTGLDTDFTR